MYRTQYDPHPRFLQEAGSRVKILYGPKYDDQGIMSLVETGKENLYEYIQSHADSVDIHVILKRFENGETDILSRVQSAYGDFTEVPTTYAELLNSVIAGQTYFQSLPVEIRANFGHSFEQFMIGMDKEDFSRRMGREEQPLQELAEQLQEVENGQE